MAGFLRNLLGVQSITNASQTKNIFQVDDSGNQTMTGMLYETAASGIVAGTTRTQAGATVLTAEVSRVDTSTAPAAGSLLGDGVLLPASVAGLDVTIINNSNNPIQVYGAGSDTINGVAAATGVAIPAKSVEIFECAVAGSWHYDAGVGFSGQLNTVLSLDGIPAAGSTQGTATLLVADINRVTSGTGGVLLPASAPGLDVYIINHAGGPIQVYGSGADTIDDVAAATGVSQMNNSLCLYSCTTTGNWYSNGIGTGYAGQYPTVSYVNGLTAHAGGGQGAATPCTAVINRFTTVATAADSAILPTSAPGMQITVVNAAATNSMNLFPATGDAINALGANVAFALAAGKTATLYCAVGGQWHAVLSA